MNPSTSSTKPSRSYPRGVALDFRKLAGMALLGYIDHHNVTVRPDAPPSELAVAVARHFESMEVDEEEAIQGFLTMLSANENGTVAIPPPYDGLTPTASKRRRTRSKMAARPGEQVANWNPALPTRRLTIFPSGRQTTLNKPPSSSST